MPVKLGFFRDANWLDAGRARGWCICLAIFSAIGLVASIVSAPHGITGSGRLLAPDFVTFYGAASFVQEGHAAGAYNHADFVARLKTLLPHATPGDYAFLYPPGLLFLCVGLSMLPYMTALCLWLSITLLALLLPLRRLLPTRFGMLAALSYPAILINMGNGQNAFATAACFAAGMVFAGRAPALSGAFLGLLAVKPQLAVLIPVGLALGRQWRSFAGAAASAIIVCALSAAVFGAPAWQAWFTALPLSRSILEQGWNGYSNMLSVFAAVRLLHGGLPLAYAAQALAAVIVLVLLAGAINRQTNPRAIIAATAVATLIATPWSLDYDLAILAAPLAWLATEAETSGWWQWEKLTALSAYVLPLLARNVAADTRLDFAPAVLLAFLLIILRRSTRVSFEAHAVNQHHAHS